MKVVLHCLIIFYILQSIKPLCDDKYFLLDKTSSYYVSHGKIVFSELEKCYYQEHTTWGCKNTETDNGNGYRYERCCCPVSKEKMINEKYEKEREKILKDKDSIIKKDEEGTQKNNVVNDYINHYEYKFDLVKFPNKEKTKKGTCYFKKDKKSDKPNRKIKSTYVCNSEIFDVNSFLKRTCTYVTKSFTIFELPYIRIHKKDELDDSDFYFYPKDDEDYNIKSLETFFNSMSGFCNKSSSDNKILRKNKLIK